MADETPVTLDDLLPLGYVEKRGEATSQICTRCGGLVWVSEDDRTEAEEIHSQWHAAIEDLTIAVPLVRINPGTQFERFEQVMTEGDEPESVKGSNMLRIPFTPEQRRELVVALGLDPNQADDCTWPAIMGRVERIVDDNKHCVNQHAGLTRGEVERLRRIEQALIDVGAPNRSERGDPGGLVVRWIQRQADLMAELKKQQAALPRSLKEMQADLVNALGLDQNTGFYDALDEVRRLRLRLAVTTAMDPATITRRHHALLMLAAKGRLEYADGAPDDQAQKLGFEADVFLTAANLVAQPNRIGLLIPYEMQTAEVLAEAGVDYPVGEVQGDGTVVVREPAPSSTVTTVDPGSHRVTVHMDPALPEDWQRQVATVISQAEDSTAEIVQRIAYWLGVGKVHTCEAHCSLEHVEEGLEQQAGPVPPRCVAHGNVRCDQCSLNPADCGSPSDMASCATYLADGMHYENHD
jgi:hypothetical protein